MKLKMEFSEWLKCANKNQFLGHWTCGCVLGKALIFSDIDSSVTGFEVKASKLLTVTLVSNICSLQIFALFDLRLSSIYGCQLPSIYELLFDAIGAITEESCVYLEKLYQVQGKVICSSLFYIFVWI